MIKRTDRNQTELMKQIRKLGYSVITLHEVGKGCPDIVVGVRGKNYLFEIKDPAKSKSQKKLTEHEVKFHQEWRGQVNVVETIDDIIKITAA